MFPRTQAMENIMKLSLTVDETCKAIGIGRTKFYALVKAKKLKAVKIGKRTYVLLAELERFLAGLDDYSTQFPAATDER